MVASIESTDPPDLLPFLAFLAERVSDAGRVRTLGVRDVVGEAVTGGVPAVEVASTSHGGEWFPGLVEVEADRPTDGGVLLVWDPLGLDADVAVLANTVAALASEEIVTVLAAPPARPLGPLLEAARLRPVFSGFTRSSDGLGAPRNIELAIVESPGHPLSAPIDPPPPEFKVVAVVIVFNEEDVIEATIEDLAEQGVHAYVIDNWSTDRTYELAERHLGGSVVGIERSPVEGPPEFFDLKSLLLRLEELTRTVEADWFIKHDADEARRSPWQGVTLRQGLWRAQSAGYNCVDFTVLNFRPVDNGFPAGSSFVDYFRHFEFGTKPGYFRQLKAWRDFGQTIDFARFGSHRIDFEGLRVFPYKFLLRHYPIRSQQHGERKIFEERLERFLPEARRRGWHTQYDSVERGSSFLADPGELIEFSEDRFAREFLIERLSGVGILRDPVPVPSQESPGEPGGKRRIRRFFGLTVPTSRDQ